MFGVGDIVTNPRSLVLRRNDADVYFEPGEKFHVLALLGPGKSLFGPGGPIGVGKIAVVDPGGLVGIIRESWVELVESYE